jgi:phosphoenolpyruvate carboxykinase (ATP)
MSASISSNPLKKASDPVDRPASPYSDPRQLGPKSQILATRTSNYHSTSLRMVSNNPSVNKTSLHPGGVVPQIEHTDLENELHEKAHIDYDRVAIVCTSRPVLNSFQF